MKLNFLFGFLILSQCLTAQSFSEFSLSPTFNPVSENDIAFSDVIREGDQDVLITGFDSCGSLLLLSKLYTNNGPSKYTESTSNSFEGVKSSTVAFADVDGDGDQDLLITAKNSKEGSISHLYINDGLGNFSKDPDPPLEDINLTFVIFRDVDGDGDQDILCAGGFVPQISNSYINDGKGNFIQLMDPFIEYSFTISGTATDINGDGDQDVLISSMDVRSQELEVNLYTNDGRGNFTKVLKTSFEGVGNSSVAFADVDGDGDQDVLIAGQNSSKINISKLYTNDGQGNFTEVLDTPFEGVRYCSIAFSDVDGDGDQDVLITGQNSSKTNISRLYTNDGQGNFTIVLDTPFEGVAIGSIAFADVDGDGDQDLLITGLNNSGIPISKLYINE